MTKPLRQSMPLTADILDDLAAAFGAADIGAQIRTGLAGGGTFWASEGGQQVGSRTPEGRGVTAAQMQLETAAEAKQRMKEAARK